MSAAVVDAEVDAWTQQHFGLRLDAFPPERATWLADLLVAHRREAWGTLTQEAAAILSIPETRFQRDPDCLLVLRRLLGALASDRPAGAALRLWSAGCASGEEAYDLGAVALEVWGSRVQVFGTDFSREAITQARAAVYGTWSLRDVEPRDTDWLERRDDGRYEVAMRVREHVRFIVGTLAEPGPPSEIDVAFCRNVLTYFSDEGCGRVVRRIATALRPDGYLVLAPSDPVPSELGSWTRHVLPELRNVPVYQLPADARRGAGRPQADKPPGDLPAAIRRLLEP